MKQLQHQRIDKKAHPLTLTYAGGKGIATIKSWNSNLKNNCKLKNHIY